jgi:putative transposase
MDITPKDRAEAIALYRSKIVGALIERELVHGELGPALADLSKQRFRTPLSHETRTYSVTTLERWYYAFQRGGLAALQPKPRSDKGRGRAVSDEVRALLFDIRREHPSVSVPLILGTLEADGRIDRGAIAPSTLRRMFAEAGLDRVSLRSGNGNRGKVRLRWQADRPGALWHADVCHGTPLCGDDAGPVRVHALLDDASRYVVALEARHHEREVDMIDLFVRALRKYGCPDALYLDNGATYRGETLSLATGRLGIALLHAKPYDAPARGKMERFWRTLREGCLDHCGSVSSLHDLNVRLWAWLDQHYHSKAHGALVGRSPGAVFADAGGEARAAAFDERALRDALTLRARRRVRRDNTLAMDGEDWETSLHFLAGQLVTVARCMIEPGEVPWIEYEGKRHSLNRVDPVANSHRSRSALSLDAKHSAGVPFDPPGALLNRALGRPAGGLHEKGE